MPISYTVSGDSFNGQYDPASQPLYFGPAYPNISSAQRIVKSASLPFADRPNLSNFELMHDGGTGYIIHLTGGPNMTTGALIGLGVSEGGIGLFVNNYKNGKGIVVTQQSGVSGASAYGILVNAGPGSAPGVYIFQSNVEGSAGAQTGLVLHAYESYGSAQKLMEWRKPNGTSSGTVAGYIKSSNGEMVVQAPLTVSGGDLTVAYDGVAGGQIKGVSGLFEGSGALFDLYNTAATANQRRFRFSITSRFLILAARNDAGVSLGAEHMAFEANARNIGLFGTTSFGGGSQVLAMNNAATVPTTDPAAGGVLYAEGGALKWRGSAGTVTTIAAA
jgi:hypothetical protein